MSKIEDQVQYMIVDKETDELRTNEVYLSISGAKTSFWHSSIRWRGGLLNRWEKTKFDEQDEYKIVKVKLVIVDE